jgi:hypothetical protein
MHPMAGACQYWTTASIFEAEVPLENGRFFLPMQSAAILTDLN